MDTDRSSDQAAAFDAVADRYDDTYPLKAGQVIATQWVLDRLPPRGRVLDVGCGTGTPTAAMLTEADRQVVGIDVSPRMLALARAAAPGGQFLRMDARDLDSSLGVFEAATAFFCLSALSRAGIRDVLSRLRAVLRPGAAVAIGMLEGHLEHLPPTAGRPAGQPVNLTLPQEDVISMAGAAGLKVEDVDVEEYEPATGDPERHLFLYCIAQ